MTIKQQQCLLTYLGYDPGVIDGVDGKRTQAALSAFTADYGVGAEGLVGAVAGTLAKKSTKIDKTGTFWDGIKHFKRAEFVCKCGGRYCNGDTAEMNPELVRLADRVREHFNKPIRVTSGIRCPKHNANSGGVANSRHLSGKAMDFSVEGFTASMVLAYVQTLPGIRYSYAIDSHHVHMDVN